MANFFSNLTFFRRAVVAGVLVVSGAANAANEKYCLALRGNGESQPAHWGALASLVEKTGLPYAQSGGSSASISLFILDTIASNPWVHNQRDENLRAALLLKSLFGMGHYITKTQEAKNALTLLKDLGKVKKLFDEGVFNMLWEIGKASDLDSVMAKQREIRELVNTLRGLGIGDAPRYSVLINSLAAMSNPLAGIPMSVLQARRLKFYAADLHQAISVLGAFDAESDGTLFFRDGIVNFEKFGLKVGRLITFLAGGKLFQPAARAAFEQFVSLCAPIHKGLTWQELTAKEPRCQSNLDVALDAFFAQNIDWEKENVALRNAGAAILSLPSTAVLIDSDSPKSAYKEAKTAYNRYHGLLDRSAAENFRVTNNDEIKFGYWGPSRVLDRANARRSAAFTDSKGRVIDLTQDAKSARFLALGPATWREVMRLSPAEPGLASLQPMKIGAKDAYSAGGWADLHPVLVLKAIGCENVVYVTRKGGESLFGQGVAKRLLGFDREWTKLRTSEPEAKKANQLLNATGDLEEMVNNPKSDWNRLYNVANPESSYMKSVAAADVVLCTDWDRWDVKTDVLELVTESYKASYVLTPTQGKVTSTPSLDAILADLRSGGAEFVRDLYSVTEGKPDWVGCRPPQARGATMSK